MNYLSGALRYVAGGDSEPQNVVPRLVDRLKTSVLPHDRRNAIHQLTDAAKESPRRQAQVGELSLKAVYAILEQDAEFDETAKATIELLIAICGTLDFPSVSANYDSTVSREQFEKETQEAVQTNIDMFLGLPNSLTLLLQLLLRDDFYIKYGTIELLAAMAANSRETLQAAVLEAPQGVSRICDVLEDSHRHIRSNAVLLISSLCEQSPEICKIVVFGAVLEKLFALVDSVFSKSRSIQSLDSGQDDDDDDSVEAAIITQDVLIAVRTLIRGTSTTKTFFRDSGCIPRLMAIFQKSIADSTLSNATFSVSSSRPAAGVRSAIEQQARKNLIIAMQCISGLISDSDDVSLQIKNDLASTDLLKAISFIALSSKSDRFPTADSHHSLLSLSISAMRTLSELLRGHEGFRTSFASAHSLGEGLDAVNAQVSTLRIMFSDSSAAIRLAAYSVLCNSFVVDSTLDLPSTSLANVLISSSGSGSYSLSENRNVSHGSLSSSLDMTSVTDSISYVAESLKEGLVGYPNNVDSAGAFYSASFVSWLLAKTENLRDRLLSTSANGSVLLPQLIRILAKLEREKGPIELRLALFSLVSVWLTESPAAVSTFLSSAMNLPFLVDVLKGNSLSGDVAESHVRGMAAVVLGICLQTTEHTADPSGNSGFLGSGNGVPGVISHTSIVDVIRSRIGIALFTSFLDDLRSSKEFQNKLDRENVWVLAEQLAFREEREGLLSLEGSLGHNFWYPSAVSKVVDDVYNYVGSRALDIVTGPHPVLATQSQLGAPNGHLPSTVPTQKSEGDMVADSSPDEVLHSYKEFIRSQDESLNAARVQIEELSAALREAQVELDSRANSRINEANTDTYLELRNERDELNSQKLALEALLTEKTADYEDALRALAAYEEEQSSDHMVRSGNDLLVEDLQIFRSQNLSLTKALDSETQKSIESSRRVAILEDALSRKEAELGALTREVEAMKNDLRPDTSEALQWRTRAGIAEAALQSEESTRLELYDLQTDLQNRLSGAERSKEEACERAELLKRALDAAKVNLENLRSTRERELQISRDSSAINAAAQDEIDHLKAQLFEASQKIAEQERQLTVAAPDKNELLKRLESDNAASAKSLEGLKIELADSKQAQSQWQKRAEASEEIRNRQSKEIDRLTVSSRELDEKVKHLASAFTKPEEDSTASKNRVAELEQQCAELGELHRRDEEQIEDLKRELSMRTEQSIRLSGQVYEVEELKANLEEEVDSLRKALHLSQQNNQYNEDPISRTSDISQTASVDEQVQELNFVKEQLKSAEEALEKSRNKEELYNALTKDRDTAISRAEAAEEQARENLLKLSRLQDSYDDMSHRLLLLDEAEDAKRALSLQVVELQKALDSQPVLSQLDSGLKEREKELSEEVHHLKCAFDGKCEELERIYNDLAHFEDKLQAAENGKSRLKEEIKDLRLSFSEVVEERNKQSQECSDLRLKVEGLGKKKEEEANRTIELSVELKEAEKKISVLSEKVVEMSTFVDDENTRHMADLEVKDRNVRRLQTEVAKRDSRLGAIGMELTSLSVICEFAEIEKSVITEVDIWKMDSLLQEVKESHAKYNELFDQMKSTVRLFEEEKENWELNVSTQTKELERLRRELHESKTRCENVDRNFTSLRDKFVLKDKKIQSIVDVHTQEMKDIQAKLHEAEKIRDSLTDQLSLLTSSSQQKEAEAQSNAEAHSVQVEKLYEELRESKDNLESLKMEVIHVSDLLNQKTSENKNASEEYAIQRNKLESQLNDLETKFCSVSNELEVLTNISSCAEKDVASLRTENKLLRSDLCMIQEKLRSEQAKANFASLSKDVEHIVDSIIFDASISSTRPLLVHLNKTEADLDLTCQALTIQRERTECLMQEVKSLQAAQPDLKIASQTLADQKERLSQLFGELAEMQKICCERDLLKQELLVTKKEIEKAISERDVAVDSLLSFKQLVSNAKQTNHNLSDSQSERLHQRITELEDALRDAARTVSATNKELNATQALLVELSSDKTSMRAALCDAEQRIHELAEQGCVRCIQRSITNRSETGVLSEVSETELGTDKVIPLSEVDSPDSVREEQLMASKLEILNLRSALSRYADEAERASHLVVGLFSKVDSLENWLRTSKEALHTAHLDSEKLRQEVLHLKDQIKEERDHLQKQVAFHECEDENLLEKHAAVLESLEQNSQRNIQMLVSDAERRETLLQEVKDERDSLLIKLASLSNDLAASNGNAVNLDAKIRSLQAECLNLASEVSGLKSKLQKSESSRVQLNELLSTVKSQFKEDIDAHVELMKDSRTKWEGELKEHQEEIERCTLALENSEREMRIKESQLKSEQRQFRLEKDDLLIQIHTCQESLTTWTKKAKDNESQLSKVLKEMAEEAEKHAKEYHSVVIDRDSMRAKLNEVELSQGTLRKKCSEHETEVVNLKKELDEENEKRKLLEEENSEFVKSTEWLEQRCKSLDGEMKDLQQSNETLCSKQTDLVKKLKEKDILIERMKTEMDIKRKELEDLREENRVAELEASQLRNNLDQKASEIDRLNRDNMDLREWVGDLERQASELQSAACDFEEVEQSLQETLESQRLSAEQINKVSEELRKERETVRNTEARCRKAEREQALAEEAMKAYQERLKELEQRLLDIRTSSVAKLSVSEANVRNQAQRCAELETALAEAECRTAELGKSSDEVFAVKAELRRSKEELERLRDHCLTSESRIETLEGELRDTKDELERMKEVSNVEGLKALEAEHNELLVYLADLELELTTLKEDADRES